MTPEPVCIRCGSKPEEIEEYVLAAEEDDFESAADYVRSEEGTYNRANGHFACTSCYIAMGMPSSPQGWIAP